MPNKKCYTLDGVGDGSGGGDVADPKTVDSTEQDPYCGMGFRRWLRGRILSTLSVSFYFGGRIGYDPLMSQYLYHRFEPKFISNYSSGNITHLDTNPCTKNKSDPRFNEVADLQRQTSQLMLNINWSRLVPMFFVALILGSFSDVIGRKALFFLPTFIGLAKMVVVTFFFMYKLDVWVLYLVHVVEGLSGSQSTVAMATFAYTADLTPPTASRTRGLVIVTAALSIAGALADVGVGYCIRTWGYESGAILLGICYLVAVLSVVFLPETVTRPREQKDSAKSTSHNPFKYVKYIFSFYVTDGTRRQRARFLVALVMVSLALMQTVGRGATQTLYQINRPFCWTSVQVGLFSGVDTAVRNLGSVTAITALQACCHFTDLTVILCALLSMLGCNVLYALSCLPASQYTASILLWSTIPVGLIDQASATAARAIMSKMAGPSRQGALFGSLAVMETLTILAASTMYSKVYQATVGVFQGAVFFCTVGIVVLNYIFAWVYKILSSGSENQTTKEIPAPAKSDNTVTVTAL